MDRTRQAAGRCPPTALVFPLRTAVAVGRSAPGMKTFIEYEDVGAAGTAYRPVITSQRLHRALK